ncbi:polysaccharide deacetylase family protein [Streptomyces sp. SCA3-4]|uniref:polysaccharide deacetylase family protein n=1 Tax=Streptomyces sichuanensis TaxID=2871810 RepID=UPI001CE374B7|nr:polysaccharide deacetylase family protein [Streptomyces sichuanensis]MCA6095629.1 polysaccharide deacetylase family protein [Streptomyces sichuanensis]
MPAALVTAVLAAGTTAGPATGQGRPVFAPVRADAADPARALYGSENRTMCTQRHVVALTFNAAWHDEGIDAVLNELHRRGVPATFFLTGDFAERHPGAARSLAAAGHGIGNHSHSHPHFASLTPGERAAEVLKADRAIRSATGVEPLPFFRFPYGDTTPQQIAEVNALGFADIEFTTDTKGYLGTAGGMSVQKVVQRALDALRPGAIVQMHVGMPDGQDSVLDAQALPVLIDAVHARGYEIVDLRGILGASGGRP